MFAGSMGGGGLFFEALKNNREKLTLADQTVLCQTRSVDHSGSRKGSQPFFLNLSRLSRSYRRKNNNRKPLQLPRRLSLLEKILNAFFRNLHGGHGSQFRPDHKPHCSMQPTKTFRQLVQGRLGRTNPPTTSDFAIWLVPLRVKKDLLRVAFAQEPVRVEVGGT